MTATRVSRLLAAAVITGLAAYLLAASSYASLPPLPGYAPVTLVLLAIVEAALASVVRDRLAVRRTPVRGRTLHPLQVARAAVLAKATSPTGAVLLGGYSGYLLWTFPHRAASRAASADSRVCAASAVAALLVVLAALALERACRAPGPPEDDRALPDLQSPA